MARRGFIELDSVLRYLDDEDRSTDFIADGSDDDLGMNSDYDYESDNLVEGILSKNNHFNNKQWNNTINYYNNII